MKKVLLTLTALLLSASFASAQNSSNAGDYDYYYGEPKTLLGGDIDISAFGAPILDYSVLGGNNEFAFFMGGGGALLFDNKFFFGGYGSSLRNSSSIDGTIDGQSADNLRVELSHGGFWTGYTIGTNKLVHVGLSSRFGWGNLRILDGDNGNDRLESGAVFVAIPQVDVELNVTDWWRISFGGGYRFVSQNSDVQTVDVANDISGMNGQLTFKFGWFD